MKKIFSVLLVITLLLSITVVFASCGDLSEKDMQKDPQQVISDAMEKSLGTFFEDKAGVGAVLQKAEKKGKYTISFECDELLGEELSRITETIYNDSEKKQFVSETQVIYNGEKLTAFIYGNNENIAVSGESVLGSNMALLFNPQTFIEEFAGSGLAELMGVDSEASQEITEMVKSVFEAGLLDSEKLNNKIEQLLDKLISDMNMTVSAEKIENEDGKEQEYIISTYTIDNSTIKKMANTLYDFVMEIAESYIASGENNVDDIKEQFDELIEELDNNLDINVTIKLYVDAKESKLYLVKAEGGLTVIEHEYDYDFNEDTYEYESVLIDTTRNDFDLSAELRITSSEISLKADIDGDDDTINIDAKLQKEVDDGDVEYNLDVTVSTGAVTIKLINATYAYEDDGDITITAKIPKEIAGSNINLTLKGNVQVDKDKLTLTFDSLKMGDEKYQFDLTITAEPVNSIPEFPENAEDIVDISKSEWEEIAENIINSDLGKLIGGNFSPEPDIDPDDDYAEYGSGYSVGYDEGYKAGLADYEEGKEPQYYDYDINKYGADSYYEGYVDGYQTGYTDAYYGETEY